LEDFGDTESATSTTSGFVIEDLTMTPEQQLRSVVESLRLVAAPAEQQLSVLPGFVSATDEVATTFGDAYLLVAQLVRQGTIGVEAATRLASLDEWFGHMPADGSIAEAESLKSHEFWRTARQLAMDSLRALKEEVREPNLSHLDWVE
jgi:hypothetical protein